MGQGLVTPRLELSDPINEERGQRQHPIYGDLGERIEAYRIPWNPIESNRTYWSPMEPNGAQWSLIEPNGARWSLMEPNRAQ